MLLADDSAAQIADSKNRQISLRTHGCTLQQTPSWQPSRRSAWRNSCRTAMRKRRMTGLMPPILLEGLKALAWYILSPDMFRCEVTETRTVQLELKTERFGMAYGLLFAYAFVRAESEQNSAVEAKSQKPFRSRQARKSLSGRPRVWRWRFSRWTQRLEIGPSMRVGGHYFLPTRHINYRGSS